jgi:hypothetical protein
MLEKLRDTSPRQRYIREQSERRFVARHGPLTPILRGELGTWQGIRIILSA